MTSPDANYNADLDYAVSLDDSITLMASKIIRDVLVTRGEPIRRAQLWQAVELAMGDRKPDVDGVLKRDWFNNQGTGPGRWELTDIAEARESPFTDARGVVNLAVVVEYLRRCRGEAPYIGDVGEFIKICQPGVELDAAWLLQSSRAIG
ncbi:MAG: hypothetical protein OXI54_03880 [Chloroflexota bacterium]|nr:hypothetical protein [Chloroflexota bacterium]MDE2683268.1 hypothetical protein [Chloroflexota bacterium]